MNSGHIIEHLRDPHPAREHGDIGNETDIAHQLVALDPGIASEHPELSLIRRQTQNGVERGAFAGAVRPDQPENAAFIHF